jgi:hypothetical protein
MNDSQSSELYDGIGDGGSSSENAKESSVSFVERVKHDAGLPLISRARMKRVQTRPSVVFCLLQP